MDNVESGAGYHLFEPPQWVTRPAKVFRLAIVAGTYLFHVFVFLLFVFHQTASS